MILNTSWSKYMEQSSKGRFVQGLHNPTHGNRAIYFYPGVAFLATIESSSPGGSANGLDMYIVEDSGEVETVTLLGTITYPTLGKTKSIFKSDF